MENFNAYADGRMAQAYSKLEFYGTYHLAYRDLPQIYKQHSGGRHALDFGCGAGRSTRFLEKYGFNAVGVDIAESMLNIARENDPAGTYTLIDDGDLSLFEDRSFDLVQSIFTFDNIPLVETKIKLFHEMKRLLKRDGRLINLVSSPEIYLHEWVSFTTKDFPENHKARSGDIVKIINTDIDDGRPVEDIVWTDADYHELYRSAGLEVEQVYKPLALSEEPYPWVNETRIAPWVIYVLKKAVSVL